MEQLFMLPIKEKNIPNLDPINVRHRTQIFVPTANINIHIVIFL